MSNQASGVAAAIIGLILGSICLLGGAVIFFICVGWASFEGGLMDAFILASIWTLISLCALVFSMTGRKKMVASGRSGALGMGGIIVSSLAVLFGFLIIAASYTANSSFS